MNYHEKELKNIKKFIEDYPEYIPEILDMIKLSLINYKEFCENRNNIELREALSDAVQHLGMKKRLPEKEIPRFLTRIKEAVFKNGITDCQTEGERVFYKRYFGEKNDQYN